ncbi:MULTISPECIES: curli production assembly/transport component CsgF [Aequorivita]|uniref:Curli production assembly/transport component CsgF n=1 Tax=Aequorivita iocasae TaxID=2803865 RepID=A0ABX7DTQ3_9FLAO|nr:MULTISPECIES: curli production assembly/transport component CsgF [Aequorivita]QQX76892.1 curli assembly protein CsgF [Aequorivita iocasae]UCA56367.1 curli assembly protein CsgF [Aequorivita sp. F7]
MKLFKLLSITVLLFSGTAGFAQQFSYKPLNPAFGGDTFNYNWLQSSATAQNKLTAPANPADQRSELEQFGDQLNRQLLSQISRALLSQQFGGVDFNQEGTYTFGSLNIEIFESGEGLVINILDTATGEETQVIVPN